MALSTRLLCIAALLAIAMVAPSAAFSVVNLGDSLSEGWIPTTRTKVPYDLALRSCLVKKLKGTPVSVVSKAVGFSGVMMPEPTNLTTITARVLSEAKAAGVKYDWAVFWVAGINDVLNSKLPAPYPYTTVVGKYRHLWRSALAQGWRVIMMPQPEFVVYGNQQNSIEATRAKLAAMLKAAVLKDRKRGVVYLDLPAAGFSGWKMAPAVRDVLYSDGLHLTRKGYDTVGKIVCRALVPYAKKSMG